MSTSDTTSNVGMVVTIASSPPPFRPRWWRAPVAQGAWRADAGALAAAVSSRPAGRCPSGQREQAVNLPALPTKVQILPGPPLSGDSTDVGSPLSEERRWGYLAFRSHFVTMTLRTPGN